MKVLPIKILSNLKGLNELVIGGKVRLNISDKEVTELIKWFGKGIYEEG